MCKKLEHLPLPFILNPDDARPSFIPCENSVEPDQLASDKDPHCL